MVDRVAEAVTLAVDADLAAEAGQDRLEVEPRELESRPGELVHRSWEEMGWPFQRELWRMKQHPAYIPFPHQQQERVCEETIISVIHNYPANKPFYSC